MSTINNALNAFVNEKLLNVHVAMPCKVLSFSNNEATIQPLFKRVVNGVSEAYPPIEKVPVIKQRFSVNNGTPQVYQSVYQAGDIVQVIFNERAIDHVLNGQIADPEFNRHHSLNDAVIVGLIQ